MAKGFVRLVLERSLGFGRREVVDGNRDNVLDVKRLETVGLGSVATVGVQRESGIG